MSYCLDARPTIHTFKKQFTILSISCIILLTLSLSYSPKKFGIQMFFATSNFSHAQEEISISSLLEQDYIAKGVIEKDLKPEKTKDSCHTLDKQLLLDDLKSPDYEQDKEMVSSYSSIFKESLVNCKNIINNNKKAIKDGIEIAKLTSKYLSDEYYINITRNCENFKRTRGYITSVLSKEEADFPIAYSVLAYKEIEMVDRLLRLIYRPQNFYCIHIDLTANATVFKAAEGIVNCFPNVFMATKRINVTWGKISVLEPELVCMKDLYSKGKWKYFINLTGQEMPLKTNLELVKILTAYQGANDMEGTFKKAQFLRWKENEIGRPPFDIRALKGSAHIVANRDFVDYVLHNKTAAIFLEWVNKTVVPDETFFSTLNHNPHLGIPGTYGGWPERDDTNRKPFLTRFKYWKYSTWKIAYPFPCHGYFKRGICILSTGDLPHLINRPEMFANKFHLSHDRVVVGCLEEELFNTTRDEFLGLKKFNATFYEGLGFVVNQVGRNVTRKFKEIPNLLSYYRSLNPRFNSLMFNDPIDSEEDIMFSHY